MTVAELIAKLQRVDPTLEVNMLLPSGGIYSNIADITFLKVGDTEVQVVAIKVK